MADVPSIEVSLGLKLLDALASDCDTPVGKDHVWRKCRHCLAAFEFGPEDARARSYVAAVLKHYASLELLGRLAENTDMDWNTLLFGTYDHSAVVRAINNADWQIFRASLIGTSLQTKFRCLTDYVATTDGDVNEIEAVRVRVTNYVNALKRGGLIK